MHRHGAAQRVRVISAANNSLISWVKSRSSVLRPCVRVTRSGIDAHVSTDQQFPQAVQAYRHRVRGAQRF
jgi:hypothetical protein